MLHGNGIMGHLLSIIIVKERRFERLRKIRSLYGSKRMAAYRHLMYLAIILEMEIKRTFRSC